MEEQIQKTTYWYFKVVLILSALAAYAIGPVPLPWIGQAIAIVFALWLTFKTRVRLAPGTVLFMVFLCYSIVITLFKSSLGDFYQMMPSNSTTGYFVYVLLRFLTIASFGSFVIITYWLLVQGYRPAIIRFLAIMCLVFSLAALYIYIAQVYGLPELPRTRIGTSGGEQATHFTYAFHRAMGTFREPSQMAEFLMLPLLVSLSQRGMLFTLARLAGILILFLTGSLSGISSIIFGLAAGFLLLPFMRGTTFSIFTRLGAIIFVGLFGFSLAVVGNSHGGKVDLIDVLWSRIEPMQKDGVSKSNRDYVFKYYNSQQLDVFGDGLGNSNLKFSAAVNSSNPVAFLSLYINLLLSLGYIGFFLFAAFLCTPFFILLLNRNYKYESEHYVILAAYSAWLLSFGFHSEELSLPFAVIYALLVHGFAQKRKRSTAGAPVPALEEGSGMEYQLRLNKPVKENA